MSMLMRVPSSMVAGAGSEKRLQKAASSTSCFNCSSDPIVGTVVRCPLCDAPFCGEFCSQQMREHQRVCCSDQMEDVAPKDLADGRQVMVVGIGGCTRSGKSSVAKEMERRLGGYRRCRLVRLDRFFKTDEIPVDGDTQYPNWELPEALDFQGAERAVIRAMEDAARDNRLQLIILEGFLVFHDERLVRLMNAKIFLRLDKTEAKFRRMNTTPVPEDYYDKLVWPAYLKYNEHLLNDASEDFLIVEADQPFPVVFQSIAQHLLEELNIDVKVHQLANDLAVPIRADMASSDTQCGKCKWWVPSDKEHNCAARQLASQAEELEKSGDVMGAMELYARAVKMDPELELEL